MMKLGGMEVGLDAGHIVLDGDPAPPPQKKGGPVPNFRPMSVVTKQLGGSIKNYGGYHLVER